MMNPFIASDSPFDINLLTLGTSIVVFVIFLSLAMKLVWPRILKGLDERDEKLRSDLEAAEEASQQAKSALEKYEQELLSARTEAGEMIAKARNDAKAAAEELRANNTRELTELKKAASNEIEAAKKAAIRHLHAEASSLAVAIASKVLGREVAAADQQSLIDESLAKLTRSTK